MGNDFLKDLGFLGITARLKRLSDVFSNNIKELYKEKKIDIEPSWHLVFLILKNKKQCSMTEIANALHLSQPAITKMINRMTKKGYIIVLRNENDHRQKLLQLSGKAQSNLPKFEKIWDAGQKTIGEILKSNQQFLENLENFEMKINNKSFKDRVLGHLNND